MNIKTCFYLKKFFTLTIEPQVNQLDNGNLIQTVPIETLILLIISSLLKIGFIIFFLYLL